jgi:hypothetical protein
MDFTTRVRGAEAEVGVSAPEGRRARPDTRSGSTGVCGCDDGSCFQPRRGAQRLAVGEERSEEPTENINKNPSPGGAAAASACLFAPLRIPRCRPFRACFQTPRNPWVPRCARHPRLRACRPFGAGNTSLRPSGAENVSRRRTRTPVGPDLVSGRACRPPGLCCLIEKSGKPYL